MRDTSAWPDTCWLAEQVIGIEVAVLSMAARIDVAGSALHAPSAGFGRQE